ncbi:MAG: tetratricopeptide repeat protein [Hyphomicrobiaceae bacterium]
MPAQRREELDQLLHRIAAHIAQVEGAAGAKEEAAPSDVAPTASSGKQPHGEPAPGSVAPHGVAPEDDDDSHGPLFTTSDREPPAFRFGLPGGANRFAHPEGGAERHDGRRPEVSAANEGERETPLSGSDQQEFPNGDSPLGRHHRDDEPWDNETAEALTRSYEAEDGVPPLRSVLDAMTRPTAFTGEAEKAGDTFAYSGLGGSIDHAAIDVAQSRLFEAARRVETVLDRLAPREAVDALGERLGTLEGEVRRSGGELARLDGIEQRLGEIGQNLTDEKVLNLFGALVPTADELTQFAEDAAGRAAERVLAAYARDTSPVAEAQPTLEAMSALATGSQLASLSEIVGSFMDERRRNEAGTLEALETLQLAMQHVLDKLERAEAGGKHVAQPPPLAIPGHEPAHAPSSVEADQVSPTPRIGQLDDARATDDGQSGFDDPLEGLVNLTARQGAADLSAESYSMPADRVYRPEGRADAERRGRSDVDLPRPTDAFFPVRRSHRAISEARGGSELPSDEAPEQGAPADTPSTSTDRRAFIAMARQAAERPNAEADAAAKGKLEKAWTTKGVTGGLAATGVIRPGVLIVAIAAVLFAGYWFLFGQKHGLFNSSASVAIEQAETKEAEKISGVHNEATPELPAPSKIAAAQSVPAPEAAEQAVNTAPETAAGPGMAVSFGTSPATYDTVIKARERARLAGLSQRAAFSAANSNGVAGGPSSTETQPQAPSHSKTTTAISTSSVDQNSGSAPGTGGQDRRHLNLPPAMTGPLSLRLAAAQGDAAAQLEVATRLAEGKGVRQNFAEAARWYEHAADQGQPIAQYRLATLYERGMGVKADRNKARALYEKAGRQGNLKAMHNLAVISASPTGGSPDYITAARLFTSAAEHGLHDSQYNLGVLYESGLGVPKDHAAAYKWYSLAARGGDTVAARRRDMLISRLPPETLQAMDTQIAAWRAMPADEAANNARVAVSASMDGRTKAVIR